MATSSGGLGTAVRASWRRLDPTARWRAVWVVIVAATVVRWAPALSRGPLEGIDWPQLLPRLQAAGPRQVAGWWWGDWVQHNGYYRPLVSLTFWLDYRLHGARPAWPWQLENLLLLALTACLAAALAREVAGSDLAGLVTGLLSVSGPAQYAVIAYVAPRTDALCGLFLVAAALAVWRWAGTESRPWPAVGRWLLALASKEAALAGAVVLPLVAAAKRLPRRRLLGLIATLWLVAAGYWLLRSAALGQSPWALRLGHRLMPPASLLRAGAEVLFPPLANSGFYTDFDPHRLWLAKTWGRLLFDLAHLVSLPLLALRAPRLLALALGWKLATALPGLPFLRLGAHYAYLPDLGNALQLGWAAAVLVRWGERDGRLNSGAPEPTLGESDALAQ